MSTSADARAHCHACGHESRLSTSERAAGQGSCPWCGADLVVEAEEALGEGVHRTALVVTTTAMVPQGERLGQKASLRNAGGLVIGSERRWESAASVQVFFIAMVGLLFVGDVFIGGGPDWGQMFTWSLSLVFAISMVRSGLFMRYGRTTLAASDGELRLRHRVGWFRRTVRQSLAKSTTVSLARAERTLPAGELEWVVDVVTDGRRLEIGRGAGLREDEAAWIAEAVRAEVAALRKALPPAPSGTP